jgi:hypothetical protein
MSRAALIVPVLASVALAPTVIHAAETAPPGLPVTVRGVVTLADGSTAPLQGGVVTIQKFDVAGISDPDERSVVGAGFLTGGYEGPDTHVIVPIAVSVTLSVSNLSVGDGNLALAFAPIDVAIGDPNVHVSASLSAASATIDASQIGDPHIFSALLQALAVLVGDPNEHAPALAHLLNVVVGLL